MATKPYPMMPLAGIDNASARDDALQVGGEYRRLYVREALNVSISETGRLSMRPGLRRATSQPLSGLWQSPVHRDVFGMLGEDWVKVDPKNWSCELLAKLGDAYPPGHIVLNNVVVVAGPAGIFRFNGKSAQPLTIETPPPPMVSSGTGALVSGQYSVAIAWVREDGTESGMSSASELKVPDGGGLSLVLPLCMDASVVTTRVYCTSHNGGELRRLEDLPVSRLDLDISSTSGLGRAAMFAHMMPMRTGRYLGLWRGRLLTATSNVLRFSQALAYHLHDPRHDFVQMPQRITFVMPVDGGIWVGQVDHVAFLAGSTPDGLEMIRKTSRAPVPGSAIALKAEEAGEIAGGGGAACVWLADNGYVLGTPDGSVVEKHALRLQGIKGATAHSIVFGGRLTTAVS